MSQGARVGRGKSAAGERIGMGIGGKGVQVRGKRRNQNTLGERKIWQRKINCLY